MSRLPASKAATTLLVVKDALQAIDHLEKELGGRSGVRAALALAPLTRDVQYFLGLLGDPDNDRLSLLELCRQADLRPGVVLDLVRQGLTAGSGVLAQYYIAKRTPAVVQDVMEKAAPYEDTCPPCQGTGSYTPDPTPDRPNPSPEPCQACRGGGRLAFPADPDARKLALDLAGLLPKGGGISITNQQVALASGGSAHGLERFQEAMDAVLFGDAPTPPGSTPLVLDVAAEPADA